MGTRSGEKGVIEGIAAPKSPYYLKMILLRSPQSWWVGWISATVGPPDKAPLQWSKQLNFVLFCFFIVCPDPFTPPSPFSLLLLAPLSRRESGWCISRKMQPASFSGWSPPRLHLVWGCDEFFEYSARFVHNSDWTSLCGFCLGWCTLCMSSASLYYHPILAGCTFLTGVLVIFQGIWLAHGGLLALTNGRGEVCPLSHCPVIIASP